MLAKSFAACEGNRPLVRMMVVDVQRQRAGWARTAAPKLAAVAPDDAALMASVAGGCARAFRAVVDRHSGAAFRVAYRMTGDASEAEEIVQEAFTRLWTSAPTLGGGAGPGGWLHRVTINLCLDRLRRRRFVSDAPAPDLADERPGADLMLDRARMEAITAECVARLPDRQRAAIILTYTEGLPNMAAAAALDLNLKAFESLLLRARTALRGLLAARGIVESGHA